LNSHHKNYKKKYIKFFVLERNNNEEIEVCIQTNELKNNIKVFDKKRSFTMTKLFKKDKDVENNESKQLKIPLLIF